MQVAATEILHFLDGVAEARRRREVMLSSAVAAGAITAVQAWPEYFEDQQAGSGSFPSTDADMSGFELERATPDSYAADMDALIRASQHVALREEEMPPLPVIGGIQPDIEWT